MRERVDRVVHCWDDGADYSIGARLRADQIWRAVVDAWVRPDPSGDYRVVGSRRVRREGRPVLELDLQHVDERAALLGDEALGRGILST